MPNTGKHKPALCELTQAHLEEYFAMHGEELPPPGLYERFMREMERCVIRQTMSAVEGNQVQAARVLGINRNTLRKKIKELAL